MAVHFTPTFPWLLYAYSWMPYPRRVIIYLREKAIPEAFVQVVHVVDPQNGNHVGDPTSFPPKPAGSLPLLAIPSQAQDEAGTAEEWVYIRQSMAIINYLEELCITGLHGFPSSRNLLVPKDALSRARIAEILSLAEECTIAWNPVRTFGTEAGTMSYPAGAKEMLRWVRRSLMTIETWWQEEDRDMSQLRRGIDGHVTIADIVLYQFLEFTKDCYGVDMTIGSNDIVRDVYGREIVEKFPKLAEFFEAFGSRDCGKRDAEKGEVPGEVPTRKMQTWAEGVL